MVLLFIVGKFKVYLGKKIKLKKLEPTRMRDKYKDFIDFKEKDIIESYLAEEIQRSI